MWTLSVSFLMESSPSASSTPSNDALITNLTGDLRARRTTRVTTTCPLDCFHSSPRAPLQSCFPHLWNKYRSSFCGCNKTQAQTGRSICRRPNLHKVLVQCRLMLVDILAVVPRQLLNTKHTWNLLLTSWKYERWHTLINGWICGPPLNPVIDNSDLNHPYGNSKLSDFENKKAHFLVIWS